MSLQDLESLDIPMAIFTRARFLRVIEMDKEITFIVMVIDTLENGLWMRKVVTDLWSSVTVQST